MSTILRDVKNTISSLFFRHADSTAPIAVTANAKRIGWWRGVPYEIVKPELVPFCATTQRAYYWRGVKVETSVYAADPSPANWTVQSGFWRGRPVQFSVAKRPAAL